MFCAKSAKIFFVKISAVIIANNEEKKIAEAINSVAWADEILLVDSESTDRHERDCRKFGRKGHHSKMARLFKTKTICG